MTALNVSSGEKVWGDQCHSACQDSSPTKKKRDMALAMKKAAPHSWLRYSTSDVARKLLIFAVMLQILLRVMICSNDISSNLGHFSRNQLPSKYNVKPLAVQVSANGGHLQEIDLSQYVIQNKTKFSITPDLIKWRENHKNNEECVPMYDWQTRFYTTCNTMHESGFSRIQHLKLINHGMIRDVWDLTEWNGSRWALKTLRSENSFDTFHMNAQTTNAIVAERLTFSKYVASIYGVCGFSALYEFASEGTLEDAYRFLNKKERLVASVQISRGMADVHSLGGGAFSPITHADIAIQQFVNIQGVYQINDFNFAYLMRWNTTSNRTCKIRKHQFITDNRSPEEIRDKLCWLDEKIDVYSLGNVYYELLMNRRKYRYLSFEEAAECILAGEVPVLPDLLENSTDVVIVALKEAMHMSLPLDPEDRATTKQVADYLQEQLEKL